MERFEYSLPPPFSAKMNSSEFNSTYGNQTRHIIPSSKQFILIDDTYLFYGYPVVVPMSIIIILIIILAIGGNIMVIITILRHRGMRTRTNMFIVNLAVADILVAAMDMPVSLITILKGRWVFGYPLCQLNGFTMALFLICSIHTLMYISVHKYISITRPFSRAMTPKRIKIMIAASWMWAMFCAIGPLIGWNKNEYKMGASQCGPAIPMGLKEKSHSALITISNYLIPLAIMIFCYSRIFREIHVHMKRIRKTSNIDLENSVAQQKKVAITLFWVLACFLLCWTPFVLYSNAAVFIKDKSKLPPILNPLAYWCGYLNSACNPIIYAFRSPSFRKGYKEIMCGTPEHNLSTEAFVRRRITETSSSLQMPSRIRTMSRF
ncbi:dopamine D2-like receptor [Uloborus diversus]|uniref:dopamine D2-like receptor n=1 Tax=Uloborus diversus TaxID=327109 RepID=UPI00240A694E|nr:dopamine D2-like receptor [Uloborus diversus]